MPQGLTQAAFNNQMAAAHASADPRWNMKQLDKAGFSRGAGQNAMAGINAAQNLAQGVANAYAGNLRDAQTNAATTLGNQAASENTSLALRDLAQQQDYDEAMSGLQRQGMSQGLLNGLLGGLFNDIGISQWLN